jgi:hypothetical protein
MLISIEFQDLVHVRRDVNDEGSAYGLTGKAGTTAARQDRDIVFACDCNGRYDIICMTRDDDTDRLNLVNAGVSAIKHTADIIKSHLAVNVILQVVQKAVHKGTST